MHKLRGFTLVEMMVVLLIAAIVLATGVPALQSMVRRQRVVTAGNDFFHAAHLTRAAAIREGRRVEMRPLEGRDWRSGWAIHGQSGVLMQKTALAPGISVTPTGDDGILAYEAQGQRGTSNTWRFADGDTQRHVVINFLGRIRMCNPQGKDAC